MNLGPWAISDMWRDHLLDRIRYMQAACEGAALAIGEWKAEIVGTTYEGGPCPGVEIVDPDPDINQIGGVSTGAKVNPSNLINQLHLYLYGICKPDPDAAYQDDVRRG